LQGEHSTIIGLFHSADKRLYGLLVSTN
ncbi:hypothetical protein HKBW3S42_02172, partial [Candidatus Hakubella thermalkaliphila]